MNKCCTISVGAMDWERMWEETGWSVEGGGPSEHPRYGSDIDRRWDEDISSYSDDSSQNSPEIGRRLENVETESIESPSTPSDCVQVDPNVGLSPLACGMLMDQETRRSKLLKKDRGAGDRRKKSTNRRNYKLQTSTPLLQRGEREVSSVDYSQLVVRLPLSWIFKISQNYVTCSVY